MVMLFAVKIASGALSGALGSVLATDLAESDGKKGSENRFLLRDLVARWPDLELYSFGCCRER
eukprot:3588041-Rhodomonas_salina.1